MTRAGGSARYALPPTTLPPLSPPSCFFFPPPTALPAKTHIRRVFFRNAASGFAQAEEGSRGGEEEGGGRLRVPPPRRQAGRARFGPSCPVGPSAHFRRGAPSSRHPRLAAPSVPAVRRRGDRDHASRPDVDSVRLGSPARSVVPLRGRLLRAAAEGTGGRGGDGIPHAPGAGGEARADAFRDVAEAESGAAGRRGRGDGRGRGFRSRGGRARTGVCGLGVDGTGAYGGRTIPAGARPGGGDRRGRDGAGSRPEGEAAEELDTRGVFATRDAYPIRGGMGTRASLGGRTGRAVVCSDRDAVPAPHASGGGGSAGRVLGALASQGVSAGPAILGDERGRTEGRAAPRVIQNDGALPHAYGARGSQEGTLDAGRPAGAAAVGWLFRGLDGYPLGEYVRDEGDDVVEADVETSAAPPHVLLDDVAGVWGGPSGVKRQVLDSFPAGLIDLGALRRLVPAKARLFAMLDDIATFRAQLTGSGVSMPGPPSKLQDGMLAACVGSGILRTEKRAFPSVCGLSVFPLAKTNGKMRLIVDARPLNTAMHSPPKFSLPTPYELSELILRGGATHAVVADFKGFFWQFPLSAEVGQFFGVRQGARRMQLTRMAMGWSWAAVIAQETSLGLLGDMAGVCAAAWIDDNLILGKSAGEASARLRGFLRRADEVGAEVNREKSTLTPVQVCTYAGIEWDLRGRRMRLPGEWRRKARVVMDVLLSASGPSLREVWKGIGAVIWATYAMGDRFCGVPDMLAWIRARGAEVSAGAIDWDDQVQISAGMRTDLRVFVERRLVPDVWRVPRWKLSPEEGCDTVVWSDACPEGWGFIVRTLAGGRAFRKWGTWSTVEDIFILELRAMAWGVLHAVRGGARRILVVGDNAAVVAVLEKGHCAVRLGNTVLERLFRVTDGAGAGMLSRWIATDRMPADELSRWGSAGQDWADPPSDGVVVDGGGFMWSDE